MAEEGGGGHGDGGSPSAIASTQRLPPPPPPQPPQPGSQAPPAPALAPDQLPQNNTLVALPIVAIENILSFMSYDEISQLRLVRPPGDPCRPLREPRSGEGPKGKSVPRGGSPWRAAAAAKAPSAPLPPQSLSWGWPAGFVQIPPLLPRSGGDCLQELGFESLGGSGALCPRSGSGATGGGSKNWASNLCPA